ncbi:uncharacterized protein GIQ15_02661 [Arthroderma uncinatum]|uniref:uncharacterized protein n=1 Tax=Arthroderma uncinatum TaxID=74035 RepID=UPI00144AAF4F|nr:uncharacterized protein GIQ15_02661 [Arthroderma uncinatum]KAF3483337.1 hypothetical protein GIQ15_02661 [Arthroderma uncinatum]
MDNVRELKPRKLWSEKEDNVLRGEVARQAEQGKAKDWRTIAEKLPGRSNKDCRKRWIKLDGPVKKGPWSQEEDQRLHKAVLLHSNVWTEVAQVVGTRHADQCAKRWLHFLNPSLNHSEWSEQEDERLLAAVERSGRNWRRIVDEILHGRSATDAKNRHAILQRNRKNSAASGSDRPRPSFSRRRRNGSTLEAAEKNDANNWWPTDSVDLMRDIFYYNVATDSGGPELHPGSNFDALLMEQSDHLLGSPLTTASAHEHPQDYTGTAPSSGWQIMPSNHSYQERLNGHGFELPTGCIPSSFENGGDNCGGITDTFFEALTTMTDVEGVVGLHTPSASSNSADCLPIIQGASDTTFLPREEHVDEDDGEEEEDEGVEEVAVEKSEELVINNDYNDPTMPSIEEILGTVSRGNRKSTMILQHMQPDQVGQVLELLFSSGSTVDVKIVGED